MKKKILFLFISLSILVFTAGCDLFNDSKENNKTLNPPIENEPVPEKELQILDPNSKTRPIAVMIDNHPNAVPHAGLQDAYLSYEMIVEGGFTRIMALFKDQDTDLIGPVRSSRHYYLDYALENDAIYVHFGWSPKAKSDIPTLGISNINGLYDKGFWRDNNLYAPHNAFTSISNLNDVSKTKGYIRDTKVDLLLNYSIDEVNIDELEEAIGANKIKINYSSSQYTSYEYDPINKVYKRSMRGIPHIDKTTKEQYTVKNIIVAKVKNIPLDNEGRQELERIGMGEGYYITNGYAVPIIWEKSSRDSQTIYKYSSGEEITVNDGNTYIQIQPISQQLLINE